MAILLFLSRFDLRGGLTRLWRRPPPGSRQRQFQIRPRPDAALLVQLAGAHHLEFVRGVRGGILIARVGRREPARERAQDVERRHAGANQLRPVGSAVEHDYTAEMTLLKKKPQSGETTRMSNAASISTRSLARCSMRKVLIRKPAPPVEPISPVQLKV